MQVTNDGATILKSIHLDNPAAKGKPNNKQLVLLCFVCAQPTLFSFLSFLFLFFSSAVLVNASKTQDAAVGDGTTSVCVLCGEAVREAERLVQAGLHPQVIIAGYRVAAQTALEALAASAVDHAADAAALRNDLLNIARTTLSSKAREKRLDLFYRFRLNLYY